MSAEIKAEDIGSVYAVAFAGGVSSYRVMANGEEYVIEPELVKEIFCRAGPFEVVPRAPRQKYMRLKCKART